ncbi:MAG TPA: alpha/beta fold hydrolase [Aestuariivirga sp.]|nr:alpha/beta fold hydrolase [Aestuariivirga sp.]
MRRLAVILLTLILAACTARVTPEALLPVTYTVPQARTVNMVVATSRGTDDKTGYLDADRATTLSFAALTVSLPPTHKAGEIEWKRANDRKPEKAFVALRNDRLTALQFETALAALIPPSGEVFVFVHGYNTLYEEGVFRLAQIAADTGVPAPILFSWPSRGAVTDYLTDRETVLATRNRFDDFLRELAAMPRVKTINIFAHSMGSMLTMETLQMAKLKGDVNYGGKLNALVLAAPDIDSDVFAAQLEVIGNRGRPTAILISRDDRALQLAQRLAGGVVRVGAATPESQATLVAIKKLGITAIDITDLKGADSLDHNTFAESPVLLQQIARYLGGKPGTRPVAAGAFIIDATGRLLAFPGNFLSRMAQ